MATELAVVRQSDTRRLLMDREDDDTYTLSWENSKHGGRVFADMLTEAEARRVMDAVNSHEALLKQVQMYQRARREYLVKPDPACRICRGAGSIVTFDPYNEARCICVTSQVNDPGGVIVIDMNDYMNKQWEDVE